MPRRQAMPRRSTASELAQAYPRPSAYVSCQPCPFSSAMQHIPSAIFSGCWANKPNTQPRGDLTTTADTFEPHYLTERCPSSHIPHTMRGFIYKVSFSVKVYHHTNKACIARGQTGTGRPAGYECQPTTGYTKVGS